MIRTDSAQYRPHRVRQWQPSFPVSGAARARLVRTFEYASRGISSTDFSRRRDVTRVMGTGSATAPSTSSPG